MIARGEQPAERVAAFEKSDGGDKSNRGKHHKTTVFASLDPPTSAQAYAAGAPQDPRLMQADSQAAITQATSGQPVPAEQAQQPGTPQPATATVAEDIKAQSRKRHVARRRHHRDASEEAVAQAPAPNAQPGLTADGQQPQQAAAEPQGQPAAQGQAIDASGYPADAAGGRQTDNPDAAPVKQKRHAAHRAHPHKATAVAAAQDDVKSQPATQ